jgi:ABC-type uncharacterized transport system involved in gliding motility auxiliary subunit
MKKNSFETALYSVIGVLVLLGVLVAFNVVTAAFKQRVDLTKEKAYTLSDGTRNIIKKLDSPATVRFYYSSSAELPAEAYGLKVFAQQVADLLAEYKTVAGGKLIIETYDPKPDSDAEDKARLDGMEGQPLPNGERFYLGLSISRADVSEGIPFFRPDREPLLEYDISRVISRVANPEKPVIGIMTGLPMFGMAANPMLMQMGQRGQEPWTLVSLLKDDYTVKQVDLNAEKIDDDIKVLLVFRPKEISDRAQYAIDQFLMRGGRVAAFLDTVSMTDKGGGNPMMGGGSMPGTGSSLDKLLKAWGIQFDTSKAVADMNFMNQKMRLSSGDNPGWISLADDGINKNDVVTSELGELWVPFAGAFTGTPAAGLTKTVLLKSSPNSQLVESMMVAMAGESVIKDFKKSDTEYALAIRLTGKFKTAFPNGKPEEKTPDDATNKVEKSEASLKESKGDTAVVLVGDTDMFSDMFCVQMMRTPFGNIPQSLNANLNFAENIVENLAGDSDLMNARSRATLKRPFTRIRAMEAKAGEESQRKINDYVQTLQETQQKLAELEQNKQPGQKLGLSPEQQAEKTKFEQKVAGINHDLRQERKNLARDKEALQNKLKWENILVMPVAVALFGIGLATFKRKRTSAK